MALIASQTLAEAVAELHGVPGQKDRRKELRHRLVDVQAGIARDVEICDSNGRIKLGFLGALDDQIVIQRTRSMVCLDELPILLGQAGEVRDDDVLRAWCNSQNLPTINFDRPVR